MLLAPGQCCVLRGPGGPLNTRFPGLGGVAQLWTLCLLAPLALLQGGVGPTSQFPLLGPSGLESQNMLTWNENTSHSLPIPPLLCKAASIRLPTKVVPKHFPDLFSVST